MGTGTTRKTTERITKETRVNRSERLAIAVAAQVAQFRLDDVLERNEPIVKKMQPLEDAFARFKELHGHDADPESPRDSRMLVPILKATGGGRLTREEVEAAQSSQAEIQGCRKRLIDAMGAVTEAWAPGDGATLTDWIGCSSEEFRLAVELAMERSN
jgi:hypothetical protein